MSSVATECIIVKVLIAMIQPEVLNLKSNRQEEKEEMVKYLEICRYLCSPALFMLSCYQLVVHFHKLLI